MGPRIQGPTMMTPQVPAGQLAMPMRAPVFSAIITQPIEITMPRDVTALGTKKPVQRSRSAMSKRGFSGKMHPIKELKKRKKRAKLLKMSRRAKEYMAKYHG